MILFILQSAQMKLPNPEAGSSSYTYTLYLSSLPPSSLQYASKQSDSAKLNSLLLHLLFQEIKSWFWRLLVLAQI